MPSILGFILAYVIAAQAAAVPDMRVASIQVKGNKRYTAEEVTRLSGLAIGMAAKPDDLNAAANKLAQTGLFENVRYSYTTGRDMTITLEIAEAPWTMPVIFDNFIDFTDEQLTNALRAEVPSFDGTAPATGGAAEFIVRGLQTVLQRRSLPGRVEFTPQMDLASKRMRYLFAVRNPSPKVCAVRVSGTSAIAERDLIEPLKGIVGGDYSRFFVETAARGTLTDMYHRKGHWRAQFATPQPAVDAACGGVSITLPVTEGPAYTWDRAEWSGAQAFPPDVLNKTLAVKQGDLADGGRIDAGLLAVRKLYRSRGYLAQRVELEPRLDDATHRAIFAMTVEEGPQFHMGTLMIEGLRDADAAMLSRKWKLKPGDVYDQDYESQYMRDEIYPLKTASGARGSVATRIDPASQTVDVTITFK